VGAATDDISERYLKKAIAEMNELGTEIAHAAGPDRPYVLGSGHPLADIFLLKQAPVASELQEGVAFFGRAGQAVLKSIQRLRVDPMAVYGTNVVKFAGIEERDAREWLVRELHVVQPRIVVVLGDEARRFLNAARFPLAVEVAANHGSVRQMTPTISALVTPDIDDSLDEQDAKKAFWEAFRALGDWWAALPPY
jgi:uracil-DNA glycosylase family 4